MKKFQKLKSFWLECLLVVLYSCTITYSLYLIASPYIPDISIPACYNCGNMYLNDSDGKCNSCGGLL